MRKALSTVPGSWKVLKKSALKLLLFDGYLRNLAKKPVGPENPS